jgi:hypothetical protein
MRKNLSGVKLLGAFIGHRFINQNLLKKTESLQIEKQNLIIINLLSTTSWKSGSTSKK